MAEALYDIKSTMIRKFELSPSKITILSCLNTNPPAGISYSMEQVEFLKKLYWRRNVKGRGLGPSGGSKAYAVRL